MWSMKWSQWAVKKIEPRKIIVRKQRETSQIFTLRMTRKDAFVSFCKVWGGVGRGGDAGGKVRGWVQNWDKPSSSNTKTTTTKITFICMTIIAYSIAKGT